MSEAGRSEGSEHRLVLKSCTRRRGGVDVCSASIDGGLVCCKRSHLARAASPTSGRCRSARHSRHRHRPAQGDGITGRWRLSM